MRTARVFRFFQPSNLARSSHRHPYWLVVLALAVSLAAGCGGPTRPSELQPLVIHGSVLDYQRGTGAAQVVLRFTTYDTVTRRPDASFFVATTDSQGRYTLALPPGSFDVTLNGQSEGVFRVRDANFRGDFYVNSGGCTAFYGVVTDARTGRVRLDLRGFQTQSDATGWYRLDLGCLASYGIGTTFMRAAREGYADKFPLTGRAEGLAGQFGRKDIELDPL